jgi:acetylglutamate kinase
MVLAVVAAVVGGVRRGHILWGLAQGGIWLVLFRGVGGGTLIVG